MERFNYGINNPEEILNYIDSDEYYFDYCFIYDQLDRQIGFVFTSFADSNEDTQVAFICDENIAESVEEFINSNF